MKIYGAKHQLIVLDLTCFSDDLQDKLNEWVAGYSIEKNEKAYKRYDPFDFKTAS